jgi:hypothetical protein
MDEKYYKYLYILSWKAGDFSTSSLVIPKTSFVNSNKTME